MRCRTHTHLHLSARLQPAAAKDNQKNKL
jgi:hypothetical protein